MSYAQTLNQLAELKFTGMLHAYEEITRSSFWQEQSFDDKLSYMVQQEYERRLENRINLRIREAKFKEPAQLQDIIYQGRNLSKDLVQRLARLNWIKEHENIIITGATGTGKSFLAQALGDHACRHLYKVRYFRVPELLTSLQLARHQDEYLKLRRKIHNYDVLILDDWGMATLDLVAGQEIAEIVEDRFGKKSTIVVSQFPHNTWDRIFEDRTAADAVMDRLIHLAYTIQLEGDSLRPNKASEELKEYKRNVLKSNSLD